MIVNWICITQDWSDSHKSLFWSRFDTECYDIWKYPSIYCFFLTFSPNFAPLFLFLYIPILKFAFCFILFLIFLWFSKVIIKIEIRLSNILLHKLPRLVNIMQNYLDIYMQLYIRIRKRSFKNMICKHSACQQYHNHTSNICNFSI